MVASDRWETVEHFTCEYHMKTMFLPAAVAAAARRARNNFNNVRNMIPISWRNILYSNSKWLSAASRQINFTIIMMIINDESGVFGWGKIIASA